MRKRHRAYDPDAGAFKARTEPNATGQEVTVKGAECVYCSGTTNNAEILRLLNHVYGSTRALGWKPCQQNLMPADAKGRFQGGHDSMVCVQRHAHTSV